MVVEGLVPGSGLVYSGRANLALAKALDADVLLVGAMTGADIDGLAETMAIAARTYRAGEHDRVVGAVANRLPDVTVPTVQQLRTALAGRGIALVGAVPFRKELGWPRLRDIVADLDVRVLNEGEPDRRVKDVIVAAQAVPGLLPLLAGGPPRHRAGRPARGDPQRLPGGHERHPPRRPAADRGAGARPTGHGVVPPRGGDAGCRSC